MAGSSIIDSSTLLPLPRALKYGLSFVCAFGSISFLSSLLLLVYLCRKFWTWYFTGQLSNGCNQFLLLIFNLVIADIQQSIAFLLTLMWLGGDRIDITWASCWAEGWFVSVGDLASSIWIFAIALHTFFAVIKGHRLPTKVFWGFMAGIWIFVYTMAIVGVILHRRDFYVRAGAWCWIGEKYNTERLWLHYFWIFGAMLGTIIVYSLIFITLKSRLHRHVRPRDLSNSIAPLSTTGHDPRLIKRGAKYMVLYPTVYVFCTLPLAAGRMAAMTGVEIQYWYYCLAGAAITSCGWLDVLLYGLTRRVLIFGDKPPLADELGLDTYGILNSSESLYGMTTMIEGGSLEQPICGYQSNGELSPMHTGLRTGQRTPSTASQARDDFFASPIAGMITTKTTIEITNRSMTDEESTAVRTMENGSTRFSRSRSTRTMTSPLRQTPSTSRRTSRMIDQIDEILPALRKR